MLQIQCDTCKQIFFVKGHTTPAGWLEPGEVVTELECQNDLCQCLMEGEAFSVIDEEHESFDDDVI